MLRFAVAAVVVVIQTCAFSLILKCHFLSLLGHMAKFINREQDCLQHRKSLTNELLHSRYFPLFVL